LGRGNLTSTADIDYWSFAGIAGENLVVAVDIPGNPNGSQLYYRIEKPDGSLLTEFYSTYYGGYGQSSPMTLPVSGTYTVRVSYSYDYQAEYRLRVTLGTPPMAQELEDNGSIAAANAITLATNGDSRVGSVAGYIRLSGDLDYFNLGVVTNGSTIFLSVRQPSNSRFQPVVSIYNAANVYLAETGAGRPGDGVAEVRITQDSTYYAVVRAADTASGLAEEYVLDAQVVPTGSFNFPNLQVIGITPPSGGGIYSGQPISFSFTVQNVGYAATEAATWHDRVVMSLNTTLGDTDDVPLAVIQHTGVLNNGNSYSVTQSVTLPDGISGDFYLIVQTDSGNAVGEFLFEGDNITPAGSTFRVNLANYPDLQVENLQVAGPNSSQVYTISWATANRGNLPSPGGFRERLFVRNQTTGLVLANVEQTVPSGLNVGEQIGHTNTVTATAAGTYQVLVTTDARNEVFEYGPSGHAVAEQNTAEAGFVILQYFNVVLVANPTNAGTVVGAGSFPSGSSITVSAVADTSVKPYSFANWTESGQLQSATTNYTFTLTRDRTLVANFALPAFQITASNNPPSGGLVLGTGTYFYGATNVLTAQAAYGYRFNNWTDGAGQVTGTNLTLTTVVLSNRFVVANYAAAHLIHEIATATLPAGLATVSGAGTYTNGETATLVAPGRVTNNLVLYTFKRFTLNGASYSSNVTATKILSTEDSTNLLFVAEYDSRSLFPLVAGITANFAAPVPATTNLILTIRFDRSMRSVPEPLVVLTNLSGALQPAVPTGGTWAATVVSNDTYVTPPIQLVLGMDGTNQVWVADAQDPDGLALALTNVLQVLVDATPPALTSVAAAPSATTATITWTSDEPASSQVNYGLTDSYGASTIFNASLVASHRVTLSGLTPETLYHFRVRSRDRAGNESISGDATFTTTPAPDLLVTNLAVTPAGDIHSGENITVQWQDLNNGPGASSGSWYDYLVVSNLATGQRIVDTPVYYNASSLGNLAVGELRNRQYSFRLPDGPNGVGTLVFIVTVDSYNNIVEQNAGGTAENNNVATTNRAATLATYPDLQVTDLLT
jgi:hypothetical protein